MSIPVRTTLECFANEACLSTRSVCWCTAGDHRIHSHAPVLRLHRSDGLHVLATHRNDWILRRLLLHPQDLRGYQDWLSGPLKVDLWCGTIGISAWLCVSHWFCDVWFDTLRRCLSFVAVKCDIVSVRVDELLSVTVSQLKATRLNDRSTVDITRRLVPNCNSSYD